jgi:hypothetical protein
MKRQLVIEVGRFRNLIEDFLRNEISADEFQTEFFERYDPGPCSDEVFNVVDRFFADVDAYVDNPAIRDPANGDLGPEELRELAAALLRRAGFPVPEFGGLRASGPAGADPLPEPD